MLVATPSEKGEPEPDVARMLWFVARQKLSAKDYVWTTTRVINIQ
jgi:hypothetical protein